MMLRSLKIETDGENYLLMNDNKPTSEKYSQFFLLIWRSVLGCFLQEY